MPEAKGMWEGLMDFSFREVLAAVFRIADAIAPDRESSQQQ